MNQAAPGTMSGTAGHEPQGRPAKVGFGGKVQCRTVALDFGGTISLDRIDHVIGQKPVDRQRQRLRRCASFTTTSGCTSFWRLNNQPHESRWPALQQAEIDHLFTAAVLSYPLGVRILRTNRPGSQPNRACGLALTKLGGEPTQRDNLSLAKRSEAAVGV